MKLEPVESEAFRAAGHDAVRRTMRVAFHGGAIYDYLEVPESIFLAVMRAESQGEAFSRLVRNAGFEYRMVRAPD